MKNAGLREGAVLPLLAAEKLYLKKLMAMKYQQKRCKTMVYMKLLQVFAVIAEPGETAGLSFAPNAAGDLKI